MGKSTLVKKLNHFYHDFISKTNDEKLIEFCDIMNNLVSNDQFLSPNMPVIESIVESIGNNEDHDEDYDPEAYLLNAALDYADILECTGTLKYGFQSRIEKLSEISDTDEFLAVFNKTLDDLYYTADELCTNFSGLYDEMQMLRFIKTSILDQSCPK